MIEEDILGIDASLNVKISSKKSMKTSQVTQLTNEGIVNSRLSSGHSHKISNVTQLTGGGIDCLSKIRRFGEGTMRLSKEDAANILDALNEWDDTIGAKELGDDEIGLDYQRWVELKLRLTDFVENKNEFDPPV